MRTRKSQSQQFHTETPTHHDDLIQYDQNWTDRTYGGRGRGNYHGRNFRGKTTFEKTTSEAMALGETAFVEADLTKSAMYAESQDAG